MFLDFGIFVIRGLRELNSSLKKIFYRFLGCKIKKRVFIGSRVKISNPSKVKIEQGAVIGRDCTISAFKEIKIGKNVQFAPLCAVYDSDHKMPLAKKKRNVKEVEIGEGSWLGHGSIILKGVKLGKNVTVAAGSVVTKCFSDNAIIGGIPAKKIGENKVF